MEFPGKSGGKGMQAVNSREMAIVKVNFLITSNYFFQD